MRITFDPAKSTPNMRVHGVELAAGADIEWDALVCTVDDRRDYREVRHVGYAPIEDRLYCVVFTDRADERRIISLRKAIPER